MFLTAFLCTISFAVHSNICAMTTDTHEIEKAQTKKPGKKKRKRETQDTIASFLNEPPQEILILGGRFKFILSVPSQQPDTQPDSQSCDYNLFEQKINEQGRLEYKSKKVKISLTYQKQPFSFLIIRGEKDGDIDFYNHKWSIRITHKDIKIFGPFLDNILKQEFLILYFLLNYKECLLLRDHPTKINACYYYNGWMYDVLAIDKKSMQIKLTSDLIFFKCCHFFHEDVYRTIAIDAHAINPQLYAVCPACLAAVTHEDECLFCLKMPKTIKIIPAEQY